MDADLRKVLSKGDWKKAAKQLVNHLPIVGSAAQAKKAYEQGDYKIACLYGMLAAGELLAVGRVVKGVSAWSNIAKQGGSTKVRTGIPVTRNITEKLTRQNTKWKQTVASDGRKVYQRNDLFDPNQISKWTVNGKEITGTNIERMAAGRAPLCKNGSPINLHHIGQSNEGSLVELTRTQHIKYSNQLHINSNKTSSTINRSQFETWKRNYWKNRAKEIK